MDFLLITNWNTREPIFTLNDSEIGKLSIVNTLGE